MKLFLRTILLVSALLAIILATHAQTVVPISSEFPPPAGLTFSGRWECKNGDLTARLQVEPGDGRWTMITESQEDVVGHFLVGYDRGVNEFLLFDVDDPAFEAFRTDGWTGSTMTLTYVTRPEINMSENRFVYHADNSSQFTVSWEDYEDTQWKTRDTYVCKRTSQKEDQDKFRSRSRHR